MQIILGEYMSKMFIDNSDGNDLHDCKLYVKNLKLKINTLSFWAEQVLSSNFHANI